MAEYIEKEAALAIIARKQKYTLYDVVDDACGQLYQMINSLPTQEVNPYEAAPEANLEAEIERWWNERYAKVDKNYKFDSTSGHYIDNEGIIDLARHFAEWERKRMLDKVVEWMKKNLTYTHPRKENETCVVNISAFLDAMNE